MKENVANFVAHRLCSQQVKSEHQSHSSLIQSLTTLEWKWERIIMDFVSVFPSTYCKALRLPRRSQTIHKTISDPKPTHSNGIWRSLRIAKPLGRAYLVKHNHFQCPKKLQHDPQLLYIIYHQYRGPKGHFIALLEH